MTIIVGGVAALVSLLLLATFLVRLKVEGEEGRYFAAWIDELVEGVLESLATQAELPVILLGHSSESIGTAVMPNGLRDLSHKSLRTISELADKARWQPHHFAAARAFIEHQEPATTGLWAKIGGK